ncbi:MAG: pyridoxal phosphate-dependent aminotransferase [Odoribacter sp.]|nr:pyridoxal phosphate-dependent aminotransferase [Odoribacter sp.]
MSTSYDFDRILDRRGTCSYKWDTTSDGVTAMWVADMDFMAAPCIIDALRKRVEHGVFGYTYVPASYYSAVTDWFKRRHGWTIDESHIIYTSGVVPAISAIIKAVTSPGDGVIVSTPAYNCFFSSIRNNDCRLVENRLVYNTDGRYTIDFEDLEAKASMPDVTAMILCNPHNPACRVWTPQELRRIGDICLRHNVFVIADEIHCELVYPGFTYTPYATLGDEYALHSATCISPSKAFNIAGLQIANIVVADAVTRAAVDKAININEVCDVNPFGVVATIAAYNDGEMWLDSLVNYIHGTYECVRELITRRLPGFVLTPLEATYLAWLDISPTGMNGAEVEQLLMCEAAVRLNPGAMYGAGGENFVRINLAAPRQLVVRVMEKVVSVLEHHVIHHCSGKRPLSDGYET